MKRRDLIKHLSDQGGILKREGGNHSVYLNLSNKKISAIPRHTEVNDYLIKKICKDLDIKSPLGTWIK